MVSMICPVGTAHEPEATAVGPLWCVNSLFPPADEGLVGCDLPSPASRTQGTADGGVSLLYPPLRLSLALTNVQSCISGRP